jgi:hypothetical protein
MKGHEAEIRLISEACYHTNERLGHDFMNLPNRYVEAYHAYLTGLRYKEKEENK